MPILDILNELSATSSKNDKIAILQREKDNVLLQQVFKAAYDPTINYFIKKIPPYTTSGKHFTLSDALKELNTLSSRKATGRNAELCLSAILSDIPEDDATVIERIIARDLKVGCTESTANKVWKNLIPEFPYMRCALLKDAKIDKWNWKAGVFSQLKADGMFANVDKIDGETFAISSRAGSQFDVSKFDKITKALSKYFYRGTRLIGELLVVRDGVVLPRQIGNGILNSVLKGGDFAENEHPIYMAWDILPLDEAVPSGRIKPPYKERYEILKGSCTTMEEIEGESVISVIPTRIVYSMEEAYEHYFEIIAQDLEGTIIKNPDSEWFDGTSKEQIKLKVEFDCDLEIVGFNEGNGRNADTFGSIECKTSDGLLVVNVSGRGDAMRKLFNDTREEKIGRILTAKSNNLSRDAKTGVYSLFLPVFQELREDKTEADSLARVIEQYEAVIKPKSKK